jgi:hypothetical protein
MPSNAVEREGSLVVCVSAVMGGRRFSTVEVRAALNGLLRVYLGRRNGSLAKTGGRGAVRKGLKGSLAMEDVIRRGPLRRLTFEEGARKARPRGECRCRQRGTLLQESSLR